MGGLEVPPKCAHQPRPDQPSVRLRDAGAKTAGFLSSGLPPLASNACRRVAWVGTSAEKEKCKTKEGSRTSIG